MKSQEARSTALVNYSKTIPLKHTTINRPEKYIYNITKKFKMLCNLVCFKHLMLRSLRNSWSTLMHLEFTSEGKAWASFYLFGYSEILVPKDAYKPIISLKNVWQSGTLLNPYY